MVKKWPISPLLLILMVAVASLILTGSSFANSSMVGKKVLVVMSYHQTSSAELKIKEGIASVLGAVDLKYFYMDTKNRPENGKQKAAEAFSIYQKFQPDAVIAADDNAQALFVLPYLKGKVTTPVVFCGVNDDAGKYGYPTSQITGILEKKHYREGVSFAKLIVPSLKRLGVLYKDNPSNRTNIAQIKKEAFQYPLEVVGFRAVNNISELKDATVYLEEKADALLVLNLAGVIDENGVKLTGNQGVELAVKSCKKPTIGSSKREIVSGLLCGVAKMNIEQGQVAASMVKEIFQGKAVSDIPITWNRNGQRVINVTTARKLAIPLKPMVLIGTDLVQ